MSSVCCSSLLQIIFINFSTYCSICACFKWWIYSSLFNVMNVRARSIDIAVRVLWRSHCRLPPRSPYHWIRLNLWFMCRLWGLKYISTMKREGEIHHRGSERVWGTLYHTVWCRDAERGGTQKNLPDSKYSPIQSQTAESTWRAPQKRLNRTWCHNKSVFKLKSRFMHLQIFINASMRSKMMKIKEKCT